MKCQFQNHCLCFLLGLFIFYSDANAADLLNQPKTACLELLDEVRSMSGFFQVLESRGCSTVIANDLTRGAREVLQAEACVVIAEFFDWETHFFFSDSTNDIRGAKKAKGKAIETFLVRADNLFATEVDIVKFDHTSLRASASKQYWGLPWYKDYFNYSAQCH